MNFRYGTTKVLNNISLKLNSNITKILKESIFINKILTITDDLSKYSKYFYQKLL